MTIWTDARRSADATSAGGIVRTCNPGTALSAPAVACAPGPSTTAAITVSAVRDGNAIPSAMAMSTGNTNIQKRASGSRTTSSSRVRVSSRSGAPRMLRIAQVPAGELHEHILQRRAVRCQQRERRPASLERRQQPRHGQVHFRCAEQHTRPFRAHVRHTWQTLKRLEGRRLPTLRYCELDYVLGPERGDQLA